MFYLADCSIVQGMGSKVEFKGRLQLRATVCSNDGNIELNRKQNSGFLVKPTQSLALSIRQSSSEFGDCLAKNLFLSIHWPASNRLDRLNPMATKVI